MTKLLTILALIILSTPAHAENKATVEVGLVSVDIVSVDEEGEVYGEAVPVPTDDGSINF